MFYYYQDVGINECKCGKEIGHWWFVCSYPWLMSFGSGLHSLGVSKLILGLFIHLALHHIAMYKLRGNVLITRQIHKITLARITWSRFIVHVSDLPWCKWFVHVHVLQQLCKCTTLLPVGQNYDYISDNVRFNQEAKDKQDWNCYTKRCIVIKENRFRYIFNNDQPVGTDKSKSCKEMRHLEFVCSYPGLYRLRCLQCLGNVQVNCRFRVCLLHAPYFVPHCYI